MKIEPIAKIVRGQDGAIRNGFLFRFDSRGPCTVYRMADVLSAADAETEVPFLSRFKLEKTELLCPHSNAVVFGSAFAEKGDEFPLLYTNIYNNYAKAEDKREGTLAVYRLTRDGDTFAASLVQVIAVGFVQDATLWRSSADKEDTRPFGNFVVDPENNILYAFTMRDAQQTTRYFAFPLPSLSDGVFDETLGVPRVVLQKEQILRQFDCPYHHYLQGACFHDGKIYSVEGFSNSAENPPFLRIIDPAAGKQVLAEPFIPHGFHEEAELIDFYAGDCYYSDCLGNFLKITF